MNKRIATAALALALVLTLARVASAQATSPDALFQYIADRIDALVEDLVRGKITAAQAAAEIEDLQFIAAAGTVAFDAEIRAADREKTISQAISGLQALLAAASQSLARNGTGDLQEAFLVRLGTAGQVTASLAAVLRGGFGSINAQQLAALQSAAAGLATTVRAPDYRGPIAQDSVATVFISRAVTGSPATAMFDAKGQLPLTLSGVTVQVYGQLTQLFYASPNQVNFLMPPAVPAGTAEVVVTGNNSAISTGTVEVLATAPAIFSEDASGRGPGAILNAVTFRRGPFSVTTPEIPGDDKRTRLAIFLTGIRNLPNTDKANDIPLPGGGTLINVAESLRVTIDGRSVPVEFGGRHPVFAGLDQINVILPAELAGRGTLDLVVSSGSQVSNTVQVTIQ